MDPRSGARSGRHSGNPGDERRSAGFDGAPIIGRDAELAQLRATIERGGATVLVGEPGIGKSTLMNAAVAGRTAAIGGALGMLTFMPYLPMIRAVGPLPDGDPALVAREVVRRVGPAGVLVLDDLHWADAATLALLERVVGRVAVLAAVRTGDPSSRAVREILRGAGMTELQVEPLVEADGVALARRGRPGLGASVARRLVAHAGGNPLLIEELSRGGPTTSLRLAVTHRLRALDAPTRDLLGWLAVAGRPMAIDDEVNRHRLVDHLVDAGLAARIGDRVEVRHQLIADIVVGGLSEEERRRFHRAVASRVSDPAESARHLAAAGDRAAAFAIATEAAARSAPGRRATLLGLAAECADGPEADGLRLNAAEALSEAGLHADAERLLAMVPPTDDERGARLGGAFSRTRWGLGDGDAALNSVEAGLQLVAGTGSRIEAELLVQRAWIVTLQRNGARAVPLARAALERIRALGLPEGGAKRTLAVALSISRVPMAEWGPLLDDALAEAGRSGDHAEELLCAKIIVASHEGSGSASEGRRLGESFVRRASALGMIVWELSIRASLITLANSQGEFARVVDAADALLAEPLERRIRAHTAGYLALALVDLGRFDEASQTIETGLATAIEDVDGQLDLVWAQAELALASGEPARAETIADRCLERFVDADYGDLRFVRIVRDWARFELERDPGTPLDSREVVHPLRVGTGPESEGIGLLTAGSADAAAERFGVAAAAYASFHRRSELRCLWARGEALRRAGRPVEGRAVLEEVEGRATELGMVPLGARIRRSLRLAGSRRSARRVPGGRLSAREREVLALVAAGLTNPQIATRLGVGRPTVARLVANAGAKLGTSSRAQAALVASEIG
ncbi:MAG: LuxR C-terminal-related transcriptional regulator [Chloroflexota bacterium]